MDELQTQLSQQSILLSVIGRLANNPSPLEPALHILLEGAQQLVVASGARVTLAQAVGGVDAVGLGLLAGDDDASDRAVLRLVEANEHGGSMGATPADLAQPGAMAQRAQAIIVTPLRAGDRYYGVFWLAFDRAPVWGDGDNELLAALVAQTALAIERAQALAAARRQHEVMAAVFNGTVDPAIVLGDGSEVLMLNAAAQDALNLDMDVAEGCTLDRLDQTAALAALLTADPEMQPLHALEFAGANGRTYSPHLTEITTRQGAPLGRLLWLRDITHFKRVNANLSDFLSTVSHDMRSPLTFMKGYCDMMGLVGPLNERQTTFVEKIESGVMQMSDMVEKILEAGRLDPETGSYELAREATDVTALAQRAVTSMTAAADKKGLTLRSAIQPNMPAMNLDSGMVGSAFTNLVENAVKYTPEGGQVEVQARIVDGNLRFSVSDNGLGISESDQQKLFRRNVRIRRKEWERVKGSGLGLFIVKNVAQRHGGDVWVESAPGQGSTFIFMIPLEGINRPRPAP
ncbi:ATP-binding protein [Aggregatilinea lenta]|uniref:ATP-binding protein n=1 Tax=Aggregatilinea lenta TaxID=913108 RepID=UPI000E5B9E3B|nr:ATP-binding protein [Aggregatilinea lenta]